MGKTQRKDVKRFKSLNKGRKTKHHWRGAIDTDEIFEGSYDKKLCVKARSSKRNAEKEDNQEDY